MAKAGRSRRWPYAAAGAALSYSRKLFRGRSRARGAAGSRVRARGRVSPRSRSSSVMRASRRSRFRGVGALSRTVQRRVVDGHRDVEKDISRTSFVVRMGRLRAPRFSRILGRVIYEQQFTGFFSNAEGQQVANNFLNFCDSPAFVSAGGNRTSLFKLSPHAEWGATADVANEAWPNAPISAAGVITSADNQLFVGSVAVDLTLANFSALPTTITLYAVTPRINLTIDPVAAWTQVLATEVQPAAAGVTYPAGAAAGVTGRASVGDYGQSPERIKAWNQMYRVLRKITFTLNGGSSHKLRIFLPYNRMVQQGYVQKAQDQGLPFMRNLTVSMFAISRTSLVDQLNAGLGAGAQPTYGVSKIGFAASFSYHLKFPASTPRLQLITPGVYSNAAPGGGANKEQLMDIIDGVLDAAAAANVA